MHWAFEEGFSDIVLPFYWSSFFDQWHEKSSMFGPREGFIGKVVQSADSLDSVGVFLVSSNKSFPFNKVAKKVGLLRSESDISLQNVLPYDLVIGPWAPDEMKNFPAFLWKKYFFLPPIYDLSISETKTTKTIAILFDPHAAAKDPILTHSLTVFKRLKWFTCYDKPVFEKLTLAEILDELSSKKAFISTAKDPALNHGLERLCERFKIPFVLWDDDGGSPLRYYNISKKYLHPLLKDVDESRDNLYGYGPFAQKIRRVLYQAKLEHDFNESPCDETIEKMLCKIESRLISLKPSLTIDNSTDIYSGVFLKYNFLARQQSEEPRIYFPLKTWAQNPNTLNFLLKSVSAQKLQDESPLCSLLSAIFVNYLPYDTWLNFLKFFDFSPKTWLTSFHNSILYFFNYGGKNELFFEWLKIEYHASVTLASELPLETLQSLQEHFEWSAEFELKTFWRHPTLAKALLFVAKKQFEEAVSYVRTQIVKHSGSQGLGCKVAEEIWKTLSYVYPKSDATECCLYARTGLELLQADEESQSADPRTYQYLKACFHTILKEDEKVEDICLEHWNPLRTCGYASKLAVELLWQDRKFSSLAEQLLKYEEPQASSFTPMTLQERGLAFLLLANTGKAIESFQELYTLHRQYFGDYSQNLQKWGLQALVYALIGDHKSKQIYLALDKKFSPWSQRTLYQLSLLPKLNLAINLPKFSLKK